MKENEQQFTDIVRRNRSTIYTVCYMFSKDNDEVADMFQEVLHVSTAVISYKYWSNPMQVLSVYYLYERTSKLNAGSFGAVFG